MIEVKIVNMYDDMNIMMHSVETQEVILFVFRPYLKPHAQQLEEHVVATI